MEKNKNSNIILKSIFFLLVLGFVFAGEASALTLSPARIEVNGNKGEVIKKDITLYNDSKTTETYYVSYSNFEAQGETGSPRFVDPKDGLGTWMKTQESTTLEPGQSKTIPLEITIPNNAYSGGHFAVVFFGNNPSSKGEGQVSIGAKTGTLVLLSVTGDVLEAGGILDFDTYGISKNDEMRKKTFFNSLPVTFQYRFKNDGNDRVKPEGEIKIKNMFYITTEKIDANSVSGNILPHSTRLFSIDWIEKAKDKGVNNSFFSKVAYQWQNFAMGPYWASLDLTYGSKDINEREQAFFFVFPWQLILCILVILYILLFVGGKLLKKYNRHIIEKAQRGMINPSES